MGNDAFFQALDVGCNAFMYLLHTWLSEKGRLIQFLFNKNHVIFFSLLFFCFFLLRFSSFIFSFRFHLFNLGFRLLFALSFRIKCKVYLFHTNGRMMYKQSVCLQTTSFSSANFFLVCFFLLSLSSLVKRKECALVNTIVLLPFSAIISYVCSHCTQ